MPCRQAKEFLRSEGVTFEDINVMEHVDARQELVRLTGQMAVPVITVGDEVVRGFDKARLKHLLGL
ncbi:MAG: NrdH-redoxin [Candidatus Rokuibacteriota bacterium]|nr:MAG: NrdH-redoxin [Candidatus Rokubacteria bacterium]PYO55579.1 MAG: NrdH-redoxin [Candidatus Rokubacteria bacterium]